MPVNGTTNQQNSDEAIGKQMDDMIRRMRRIFAESSTMDIMLPKRENSKDQTLEGGINGYMFTLQRGVLIENVPQPILEVLNNAGVIYSRMSELRLSAAVQAAADEASQRAADEEAQKAADAAAAAAKAAEDAAAKARAKAERAAKKAAEAAAETGTDPADGAKTE